MKRESRFPSRRLWSTAEIDRQPSSIEKRTGFPTGRPVFAATRCRQIEVAADGHQQDDQGSTKALRRAYRVSAGVEEDRRSEYISIDRQGTGHGGLSLVFCCSVIGRDQQGGIQQSPESLRFRMHYQTSASRKSSKHTIRTPFSFPTARRSSVTTYLG